MYVKIGKAKQALSALGIVAVGALPTGCASGGNGNSGVMPAQVANPDCGQGGQAKTRGKAAVLRHSLGIHANCVVSN